MKKDKSLSRSHHPEYGWDVLHGRSVQKSAE